MPITRHTSPRGNYDRTHRARRATLLATAIGNRCPLCHQPMTTSQRLDLDHTTPAAHGNSSPGDRIVHATCNTRRGHAAPDGWGTPTRRPPWETTPHLSRDGNSVAGGCS